MPTPLAWCRPPRWRSLFRKEPTSDVLCRLTGTDHRLQPTHRCPASRSHLAMRAPAVDSPARPAPSRDDPVKGAPSDDAGRLEWYRDASQAFAPARSTLSALVGEDKLAQPAHPFARSSTAVRVSCGVSALGAAIFFGLGPSPSVALASAPGHPETDERDQRCVRSVPASHHSLMSTRTPSAPGSSSPTLRRACTRWDAAHQDRRSARFTACLNASADPARIVGACSSPSPVVRATMACDRASDTPVAATARYRGALFAGALADSAGPPRPLLPPLRERGAAFPGPGRLLSRGGALLFLRSLERRLRVL